MYVKIIHSDARSREKPCLRCGYSLRKLFDIRHCPECGLSVWLSLSNNDSLDASNPAWLRRMSFAAWGMAGVTAIGILAYAVVLLATFGHHGRRTTMKILLAGAFMITYHAGLWFLAAHEQRYPDKLKVYRIAAQVIAVIGVLCGFLLLCGGFDRVANGRLQMGLLMSWDLPLKAICLAGAISTFAFLRKLARRTMNSRLSRLTGYLLLGPVTSLVLVWPILVFYLSGYVVFVLSYLPWIYYPASVAMLVWYAMTFRGCADNAEKHWSAETVSAEI